MVYKHAYLNTVLLLHSAFILSMVKVPLKGEFGGHALNSNGNYIVDQKSWNCVFKFCGNPVISRKTVNTFSVVCFVVCICSQHCGPATNISMLIVSSGSRLFTVKSL